MTKPAEKPIKNLMIIDDDETDHFLCKRIINRTDLVENVIQFFAADDALDFLLSDDCPQIDAITLDINMPRMDGFEFLEKLQERRPTNDDQAVIVMLTTSLDPRDEERARKSPFVKDCFFKPFREEHVEAVAGYLSQAGGDQS